MNDNLEFPRLEGYFRIFKLYISKKYLFIGLSLLIGLCMLYASVIRPFVMTKWFKIQKKPTFVINSPYMDEFSGEAKLISTKGDLIYEGEILNGRINGGGKLFEQNTLVYDGEFSEDVFEGYGKLYFKNGNLNYEGDFSQNLFSGLGTLYYENQNIKYEGQFENGAFNGEGKLFNNNGGLVYDGEFSENFYSGYGILFEDGIKKYAGEWENNQFNGYGKTFNEAGGLVYEGDFVENLYNGQGTFYDKDGKKLYIGEWENGRYEGAGKLFENEILKYEGEFSKGEYHGEGTLYNTNSGFPMYSGKFVFGNYMDSGTFYDDKGNPFNPASLLFDPVPLIGISYEKLLESLEELKIDYLERETEEFTIAILEDYGVVFEVFKEDEETLNVKSVYYCMENEFGKVTPGMNISDIYEIIGSPSDESSELINFIESFCLNLSNIKWFRAINSGDISSAIFQIDEFKLVVYYEKSSEVSVFFKVTLGANSSDTSDTENIIVEK